MIKIAEFLSLWAAIIASSMLALNIPISGWGYVLFLVSNLATVYIATTTSVPKVLIYQSLFFIFINIVGIFRWLL